MMNGDDSKCKKHLRVSYNTIRRLAHEVAPKLFGWDTILETLVFLLWLGSGSSYRIISLCTGIPKSTVFDIVNKYLTFLSTNVSNYIKFPDQNELITIGSGFAHQGEFINFLSISLPIYTT